MPNTTVVPAHAVYPTVVRAKVASPKWGRELSHGREPSEPAPRPAMLPRRWWGRPPSIYNEPLATPQLQPHTIILLLSIDLAIPFVH